MLSRQLILASLTIVFRLSLLHPWIGVLTFLIEVDDVHTDVTCSNVDLNGTVLRHWGTNKCAV